MKHGFLKVAAVTPKIRIADCDYNAKAAIKAIKDAALKGAQIICLPELCVTGYTCGDLFFQKTLQDGAIIAVQEIAKETKEIDAIIFVGAPFALNSALYNCAFCLNKGKIVGIVPKTHLPNYAEFYEMRHFSSCNNTLQNVEINGEQVLFGTNIIFCARKNNNVKIAVEICEDLWAPIPPGTYHALAGACVIANLSASNEVIGKAEYRRELIKNQSARLLCGYIYSNAGAGESTSDIVFGAHNIIAENGRILKQSMPFEHGIAISEIDVEKLVSERIKNTSFCECDDEEYAYVQIDINEKDVVLTRGVEKTPFVPQSNEIKASRCEQILTMQAQGLATRLEHTNAQTAVVGISGGLDSCLALLATVRAFKIIGAPVQNIVAVTMPCFGTTQQTLSNAQELCAQLGVTLKHINITNTVKSNFNDIGHDENNHDVTYENTQARVRTLVLMNLANSENGLVIGTGDLSELALGWATYNGDHMSMYSVNCSVPKTLVRHIVEYVAHSCGNEKLEKVLKGILDTPVSPELLPAQDGKISQQTEQIVGPYILHDFFLYYLVRYNFTPSKIYFLACEAFKEDFDKSTVLKWMHVFYKRFFSQQFKRNCVPDGPKVGSVALSPRGDWRMPSEAVAKLWLLEIEKLIEDIKVL